MKAIIRIIVGVVLISVALIRLSWAVTNLGNDLLIANVGVGTTTPQAALAITNGNVGIGTWTAQGGRVIVRTFNVGVNSLSPGKELDIQGALRASFLSGGGAGITDATANGWVSNGNGVYSASSLGNVGIGTSAPLSIVEVSSNVAQDLFRVNDSGTADNSPFFISSTGNIGIGTFEENALVDITSTAAFHLLKVSDSGNSAETTPFIIDLAGNVGIGTTIRNPRFTIDGSGDGSGDRFVWNALTNSNRSLEVAFIGSGTPGTGGPALLGCITNTTAVVVGVNSCLAGEDDAIAGSSLNFQFWGGFVGIGTFDVGDKLIVQNGNTGVGTTNPGALLEISSSASQDLFKISDSAGADTTPFIINSNGNIGIGTSTSSAPLDIVAADNSTAMRVKIGATQANVTRADDYMSFNSLSGVEAAIEGDNSTPGFVNYTPFTGSHWTIIENKNGLEVNMLLEATGEKFLDSKEQLVKSKISSTQKSKAVWGVYGGPLDKDKDLVLSLGTAQVWVANTNGNIDISDCLQSSSVPGLAEKQDDNVIRNYTVAKALEPVIWQPGETKRLIACTLHAG